MGVELQEELLQLRVLRRHGRVEILCGPGSRRDRAEAEAERGAETG